MMRQDAMLAELPPRTTALLHHFVHSVVDYALYMLDADGNIVNWSLGAERIKGYRAADIVGRHFSIFYTDEDRAAGLPAMALTSALRTGHYEADAMRVRSDGSQFLAHVVINPIYDDAGGLLGFAKITRDITEEHALEQRRRDEAVAEAARVLSAARAMLEERCSLMVEAAPNAMVLVNEAGAIEMVNQQAELRFGYTRAELLGQNVDMLAPDAVRPHHAALRGGFLAHAETRPMGKDADLCGRRKDGTVFPVEIGLNTIKTEDGLMVLAAIVDITERRQAEATRRQQALELSRANTELQEFAYVVSHDLKAPLRAISLLADWITDDISGNAGADTLENLRLMGQRVGRLAMLLDGLLSYTRVGHSRAPVQTVDISALIGDIVESIAPPTGFVVRYDGVATTINTARPPLEHVLQNLISNAIKHHDMATGEVVITATPVNGVIEFCVGDDGHGIAPEFHKRVFTIFQTLRARDDNEASGVGLSIVQKTVERVGGRVWIDSAPPRRGAKFLFTWPEGVEC
jgi:PAS domain S-box-containing protein